MSDILTEDQLRAALIAGETENLISVVPANLTFCENCGHYGDARAGCEADIRFDQTQRIRLELIDWIKSLPNPAVVSREYFLSQVDRICPERIATVSNNSDG